jgi:multiple sugar transport system ATP-binding protein
MNFVDVKITKEGSDYYATSEHFKIRLLKEQGEVLEKAGYIGKDMIMGIRPKDFYDKLEIGEKNTSHMEPVKITVDFIEMMGSETFIHFKLGDTVAVARVSAARSYSIGDEVELYIDTKYIHLFDKDTEKTVI